MANRKSNIEDRTDNRTEAFDRSALGHFIRSQRKLAKLSQRELARLADLSDPYVSQIERGKHDPSIRVLKSLSKALNVRADTLLAYAGWLQDEDTDGASPRPNVEVSIMSDHRLTTDQQNALVSTYRAFLAGGSE